MLGYGSVPTPKLIVIPRYLLRSLFGQLMPGLLELVVCIVL
jgi:hypothetical protein